MGRVQYVYQGEGDVTEVKVGLGWEIFKNFSLGVAAQYYWGDIDRSFVMTPTPITGDGTFRRRSAATITAFRASKDRSASSGTPS